MGSTPNYSWPYPALTDPPNVPQHLQTLADAADATVKSIDTRLATAETKVEAMLRPPFATLAMTGGATITHNTTTALYWDVEYADTGDGHSIEVNNTRYTASRKGRYLFVASLAGNITAPGYVQFNYRTGGTGTQSWGVAQTLNAGDFTLKAIHFTWLEKDQYVEVMAYQTTGQSMTLKGNATTHGGCSWTVTWLGET